MEQGKKGWFEILKVNNPVIVKKAEILHKEVKWRCVLRKFVCLVVVLVKALKMKICFRPFKLQNWFHESNAVRSQVSFLEDGLQLKDYRSICGKVEDSLQSKRGLPSNRRRQEEEGVLAPMVQHNKCKDLVLVEKISDDMLSAINHANYREKV
ncbi:unnamed protein product [Ilex paraguariensis]|uniref:Uncharacterized protein n=1 Tax=Ilex paraguariensis TaxID=185542 RepID=A0ABC8T0H6_9AQUA